MDSAGAEPHSCSACPWKECEADHKREGTWGEAEEIQVFKTHAAFTALTMSCYCVHEHCLPKKLTGLRSPKSAIFVVTTGAIHVDTLS